MGGVVGSQVYSAATPLARVAALRAIVWQKAPGHPITLSSLVAEPWCRGTWCRSSYENHFFNGGPVAGDTTRWPAYGRAMSADYVARIYRVARAIEQDPRAPRDVRRAAGHARDYPKARQLGER